MAPVTSLVVPGAFQIQSSPVARAPRQLELAQTIYEIKSVCWRLMLGVLLLLGPHVIHPD
jgi:hypothetical protein